LADDAESPIAHAHLRFVSGHVNSGIKSLCFAVCVGGRRFLVPQHEVAAHTGRKAASAKPESQQNGDCQQCIV
jgi:hypothetical protein